MPTATAINPYLACSCAPGSPEKIAVLTERARLKLPLHVDGDATDCRSSRFGRKNYHMKQRLRERLAAVEDGLERGERYRDIAQRLGVTIGHVSCMAFKIRSYRPRIR